MKKSKRFVALAIAAVMTVLGVGSAMAAPVNPYDAVAVSTKLTGNTLGLKESFEVTEDGTKNPAVTYTLKINSAVTPYTSGGKTYGVTSAVTTAIASGDKIADVTFAVGEVTGKATKVSNYADDSTFIGKLKATTFSEPGIYYWEILKESTLDPTTSRVTNHNMNEGNDTKSYLIVTVEDVNGVLEIASLGVTEDASELPDLNEKNTTYEDEYPAKSGTFTLSKEVTGNQGSKDEYFKYDVTITGLAAINGTTLGVSGANSVKTATLKYEEECTGFDNYDEDTTNNFTISEGQVTATFWLKHGESITIANIPEGAKVSTTETIVGNTGYTTTTVTTQKYQDTTKDDVVTNGTSLEVSNVEMTDKTVTVEYTNNKNITTPTGIFLAMGPGLSTLVIAGAGLAVVGVSRRKKENDIED